MQNISKNLDFSILFVVFLFSAVKMFAISEHGCCKLNSLWGVFQATLFLDKSTAPPKWVVDTLFDAFGQFLDLKWLFYNPMSVQNVVVTFDWVRFKF